MTIKEAVKMIEAKRENLLAAITREYNANGGKNTPVIQKLSAEAMGMAQALDLLEYVA